MSVPIQVSNIFIVNSRAKSSEVNQNFSDLVTILSAHHHDPNIYTNATPITNSGIAPNAQIRDTQFYSQITRSGLINQTSLGQIDNPGIITPNAVPNIAPVFGDGSDGIVTISTPTTLTRDMYYDSLTINSNLNTNGFRVFVQNIINGSGVIFNDGNAGGGGGNANNTGGSSGSGTAGAFGTVTQGYFVNIAGGVAGNGNNGNNISTGGSSTSAANVLKVNVSAPGGAGGKSNNYASNTSGGGGNSPTATLTKFGIIRSQCVLGIDITITGATLKVNPSIGGGGGGAGMGDGNSGPNGGGGGGGGASGGIVFICARLWQGTFTIRAKGGAGGNGGNGVFYNGYYTGGGGGGGGGDGGANIIIYNQKTWSGSHDVSGGSKGTGGIGGGGSAANGGNGTDGGSGIIYELKVSNLI